MTRCPAPQVEREVSYVVEADIKHRKNCLEVFLLIQEKKRHQQPPSRRAIV
ncbi:uncharacterized protein METZ01_LOCUS225071, partial [marine metagenome]